MDLIVRAECASEGFSDVDGSEGGRQSKLLLMLVNSFLGVLGSRLTRGVKMN